MTFFEPKMTLLTTKTATFAKRIQHFMKTTLHFPTVSLYRSCKVKVNFGESEFKSGIDLSRIGARRLSDRVNQIVVEGALSDALYCLDENLLKHKLNLEKNKIV